METLGGRGEGRIGRKRGMGVDPTKFGRKSTPLLSMSIQTFTSAGNEGVIYSLSWSPADLHCIVASTSRNGVFILDVDKGKVIRRLTEVKDLAALLLSLFLLGYYDRWYIKIIRS